MPKQQSFEDFIKEFDDYIKKLIYDSHVGNIDLSILKSVIVKRSIKNISAFSQQPGWSYYNAFNLEANYPDDVFWNNIMEPIALVTRNSPGSKAIQESIECDRIVIDVEDRFQRQKADVALAHMLFLVFAYEYRLCKDVEEALKQTKEFFELSTIIDQQKYCESIYASYEILYLIDPLIPKT